MTQYQTAIGACEVVWEGSGRQAERDGDSFGWDVECLEANVAGVDRGMSGVNVRHDRGKCWRCVEVVVGNAACIHVPGPKTSSVFDA